jgi:hypothetical protein
MTLKKDYHLRVRKKLTYFVIISLLRCIVSQHQWGNDAPFRPASQRPSDRPHAERCLTEDEWRIAQREIDWDVESHFGYTRLDCHRCHGDSTLIGGIVPRYAPDPIGRGRAGIKQGSRRIAPNKRRGVAAATNDLSSASSPKGRGNVQRATKKQSAAEKFVSDTKKRVAIRGASATADPSGPSSIARKGQEESFRKKKDNPFSLPRET